MTIANALRLLGGIAALTWIGACSGHHHGDAGSSSPTPIQDQPGQTGQSIPVVVKSIFRLEITTDGRLHVASGNPATIPISVINSPSSDLAVDTSKFVIPSITGAPLSVSFGQLSLSNLQDNSLRVCGKDGKTKCGNVIVRMYTTGTKLPGLNSADGQNAPLNVSFAGGANLPIGLEVANATIVQTVPIAADKNVFRLSDIPVAPIYKLMADTSNAGAGSYSASLILEYGLTQ